MTTFNMHFEAEDCNFEAGFESAISHPAYDGPYTLTPSATEQTIEIGGQVALRDITINPIPSNYGLITWDGQTITVS